MNRDTPHETEAGLYTIGYHGKELEFFVEDLVENKIRVLCDVRKNAISRRKGFSKKALRLAVEAVGIKYVHLPELGIPTEDRRNAKSPTARRAMFADYKATTIPREHAALKKIVDLLKTEGSVALTCVEVDPHDCHRSIIADAVCSLGKGIKVVGQL